MAPESSRSTTRYLHPFPGEPPTVFAQQLFTSEEAYRKLPRQNTQCARNGFQKSHSCLLLSRASLIRRERLPASTLPGHTATYRMDRDSTCWSALKTKLSVLRRDSA